MKKTMGSRYERRKRKNAQRGLCIEWLFYHGYLPNRARSTPNTEIADLLKQHFPYEDASITRQTDRRLIGDTARLLTDWKARKDPSNYPSIATSDQHLYFVGDKDKKVVKIGIAKDVKRRCASLQSGFPLQLYVYRVIKNAGRQMEKILHSKYAEHNSHGEWFYVRGEIADSLKDVQPIKWQDF